MTNLADAAPKGTKPAPTKKPAAKKSTAEKPAKASPLSDDVVVKIREEHAKGATMTKLAEKYNTSTAVVSLVVRGLTYENVGGPVRDKLTGSKPFTDEQYQELLNARLTDLSWTETTLLVFGDEKRVGTVYRILREDPKVVARTEKRKEERAAKAKAAKEKPAKKPATKPDTKPAKTGTKKS